MPQPGRGYQQTATSKYKFGYQGSEKDDDIGGKGNYFTTEFREGDTRLMRWWSPDPKGDLQPWQSPYNYMDGNPVLNNDPDGDNPPGIGYSNPMYVVAEGFRQYFQAAGTIADKAFVSVSTTFSKIMKKVEGSIGLGTATVTSSVDVTNTTTVRTNLGGYMKMNNRNTPSEPVIKVTNTTEVSQNTKTEVKVNVRGVDVKSTNTVAVSLLDGKGTVTKEVMVGKKSSGAYVSNKVNSSGSQTDVGLKASYKVTETTNSSTTFLFKMGVTVNENKKK